PETGWRSGNRTFGDGRHETRPQKARKPARIAPDGLLGGDGGGVAPPAAVSVRRFGDEDFHAAVLRATAGRAVVRHRLARAAAVDADAAGGDAARDQVVAGGSGAVDRQRVVDRVAAGAVGV